MARARKLNCLWWAVNFFPGSKSRVLIFCRSRSQKVVGVQESCKGAVDCSDLLGFDIDILSCQGDFHESFTNLEVNTVIEPQHTVVALHSNDKASRRSSFSPS